VNFSSLRAIAIFVLIACGCLVAGIWLRAVYAPEWLSPDTMQHPPGIRPWQVEADCYSQLARVQRILNGQGLLQNHFTAENWPEGLTPSTTAPFDYAILLLYFPLWLFTKHPLDWAGALVSPALWIALVGFWMLIRSREFNLVGRALLIAGSAALPAIIWATACGRPRHQSLILVLMAMGFTAEYERWQLELTPKRAWNILAGIVWGLACWTSLYEPAVVAGAVIVFNLVVRRRENAAFLGAFGVVLLVMTLLEGGHIFGNLVQIYELRNQPYAHNWLHSIAEVQPAGFVGLVSLISFVVIITPILAWCLWPRGLSQKTDMLMILLAVLLIALTLAQSRWNYYASLAVLFLVVRNCQALRPMEVTPLNLSGVLQRVGLVVLSAPFLYWCLLVGARPSLVDLLVIMLTLVLIAIVLVPAGWAGYFSFSNPFSREGKSLITLSHWTRLLILLLFFIGAARIDYLWIEVHAVSSPNQPSLQLAKISSSIDAPGGIMAPWWLSPGLLYFSGHPIVSGSSHAGMSGIVASAKFFSARSWTDAEKILDDRKVRWIVVWDDPRLYYPVLNKALDILGQPIITDDERGDAGGTVAQMLVEDHLLPTAFHLRSVVEGMKLYEYVPDSP
jgi:hypothetical protein